MRRTQQQIIVLYLASRTGEWFPSFDLSKKDTGFGWIGSQGERRARELAEMGQYELNGVVYYIEKRQGKKYAEYRVTFSETKKPKFRYEMVNGVMREIPLSGDPQLQQGSQVSLPQL